MKKVLLVIIDALASRIIRPAIDEGRLPYLQSLISAGYVDWNCTSIFPSITPAATAALITGGYPSETGISGAYFYDVDEDHVHYYGDDIGVIMRHGFSKFFNEFLVRLNSEQLRLNTAYEIVESAGGQAACLNFFWYRGDTAHQARVPWVLRLWPGVPPAVRVHGASLLCLGDFVTTKISNSGPVLHGRGGMFRRFGFTDVATTDMLMLLAEHKSFPDLTVAYFPDNDFDSHTKGPRAAVAAVENVDRSLAEVAKKLGSLNAMLDSLVVMVTGDHSQSDLPGSKQDTGIELEQVLEDYSIVPAGENWSAGDELMICPNMRAAQIYLRPGYWHRRDEIISRMIEDARVDQVIWRTEKTNYCVLTKDRGRLEFELGGDVNGAKDEYGALWNWRGNLAAVDARISDEGMVRFEQYPNAFERIAAAFDARVSGDIWVTSRLGHEFRVGGTKVNRRGSHGSLHYEDSLSPLIVAGCPHSLLPQTTPRSVDIAPLCLSVLGLQGMHEVGASHARCDRSTYNM